MFVFSGEFLAFRNPPDIQGIAPCRHSQNPVLPSNGRCVLQRRPRRRSFPILFRDRSEARTPQVLNRVVRILLATYIVPRSLHLFDVGQGFEDDLWEATKESRIRVLLICLRSSLVDFG